MSVTVKTGPAPPERDSNLGRRGTGPAKARQRGQRGIDQGADQFVGRRLGQPLRRRGDLLPGARGMMSVPLPPLTDEFAVEPLFAALLVAAVGAAVVREMDPGKVNGPPPGERSRLGATGPEGHWTVLPPGTRRVTAVVRAKWLTMGQPNPPVPSFRSGVRMRGARGLRSCTAMPMPSGPSVSRPAVSKPLDSPFSAPQRSRSITSSPQA